MGGIKMKKNLMLHIVVFLGVIGLWITGEKQLYDGYIKIFSLLFLFLMYKITCALIEIKEKIK